MEYVQGESKFMIDFFTMKKEKTNSFHGPLFRKCFEFLHEHFENCVNASNDVFSVLIIALLNGQTKKLFDYRGDFTLDWYFNQIN